MKPFFIIFSTLLLFWGCNQNENTQKQNLYFLLFDVSLSTDETMTNHFVSGLNTVLNVIEDGDIVVAASISDKSQNKPDIIIKHVFEKYIDNSNDFINDRLKLNFQEKISGEKDSILNRTDSILHHYEKSSSTDIINALLFAAKTFTAYSEYNKYLIVFSDMIESSPKYEFSKLKLDDKSIDKIIEELKKDNNIAKLNDVKVFIVCESNLSGIKYNQIQNFWFKYFENANTVLLPENYNSILTRLK